MKAIDNLDEGVNIYNLGTGRDNCFSGAVNHNEKEYITIHGKYKSDKNL